MRFDYTALPARVLFGSGRVAEVADEVRREVQHRVEKREQAEHPPVTDDDVPAREPANWRDGERNDDEAERPDAGLVGNLDERIGGEVAVVAPPHEMRKGDERGCKDDGLQ